VSTTPNAVDPIHQSDSVIGGSRDEASWRTLADASVNADKHEAGR